MNRTRSTIAIILLAAILAAGATLRAQQSIRPKELSAVSRAVFMPGDGMLSPDGRLLAYLDSDGLAVRDLTSGAVRIVVAGAVSSTKDGACRGFNSLPAWSGDGAQLAYLWCFAWDGPEKDFMELRTIGADGRGDRVVHPKTDKVLEQLAWSPDGRNIAVSYKKAGVPRTGPFSIALISGRTGSLQDLNSGMDAPTRLAFSPDGRTLAYNRRSIFVLLLDGGTERRVFPSSSSINQFQGWTPDGHGILFTSDRSGTRDLWRVNVENGRTIALPARLLRDVGDLSSRGITSDGSLYYRLNRESAALQSDAYVVSTDPTTGRVLSKPAAISQSPGFSGQAVWSRDGHQLAVRVATGWGREGRSVSILSLATGDERRVQIPPTVSAGPRFDWSPDRKFFLFGVGTRIDAQTGAAATIAGINGEQPRWSADGKSVAGAGKGIHMWDLEPDGLSLRNQRTIIDDGGVIFCYALSPDGVSVAWAAVDSAGKTRLKVKVLSTGATRLVTDLQSPAPVDAVTWSPDSRHIVFVDTTAPTMIAGTNYKQSELWRVPLAGGKPEKLGLTLDHIVFPAYSPDGRFLAFTAMPAGPGGVFVIDKLLPASGVR